jgi:hypothetical protein
VCFQGHCSLPRVTPRHIVVRTIKRKKLKVRRQLRVLQKRGSIRSQRSLRSVRSSGPPSVPPSGPPTPLSIAADWKKLPLPNIKLHRMEDDMVMQPV